MYYAYAVTILFSLELLCRVVTSFHLPGMSCSLLRLGWRTHKGGPDAPSLSRPAWGHQVRTDVQIKELSHHRKHKKVKEKFVKRYLSIKNKGIIKARTRTSL